MLSIGRDASYEFRREFNIDVVGSKGNGDKKTPDINCQDRPTAISTSQIIYPYVPELVLPSPEIKSHKRVKLDDPEKHADNEVKIERQANKILREERQANKILRDEISKLKCEISDLKLKVARYESENESENVSKKEEKVNVLSLSYVRKLIYLPKKY